MFFLAKRFFSQITYKEFKYGYLFALDMTEAFNIFEILHIVRYKYADLFCLYIYIYILIVAHLKTYCILSICFNLAARTNIY